ncbi:MAG TPA: TetR/AcrR family transcriptional regulator [Halanaerobiales bacterium]|nr:TetR/AcrR family transcriptional regulator [Halanaerobiales bacterium]
MPRHFSDEEKKIIKKDLLEKGEIFFIKKGLKKATIAELTGKLGIAKGSFYNFFKSKEELYYEIFQLEAEKLRKEIKGSLLDNEKEAVELLKEVMMIIFKTSENNLFLNRVFTTDELSLVFQKLGAEKTRAHRDLSSKLFLSLIIKWQQEGELIEEEPEVILGIIRSIIFVGLHRQEIGDDVFSGVMEHLIKFTAEGLIRKN